MFLPIYVTKYWFSAAIIDPDIFEVKQGVFVILPYEPDYTQSALTLNKLDSLLKKHFKSDVSALDKLFIADEAEFTNIPVGFTRDSIEKQLPIPSINLDAYNSNNWTGLNEAEINTYMNLKHYHEIIPEDMRMKLNRPEISGELKADTGAYIGADEVAVMTTPVNPDNRGEFISKFMEDFAELIQITGMWKFSIDDRFQNLLLGAVLMHSGRDIKEHFISNSLHADGKLIIAPEVAEIEIQKDGEAAMQPHTLNQLSINKIPLPADQKIRIKWKAAKSKFDGEVYGSDLGLYIKT